MSDQSGIVNCQIAVIGSGPPGSIMALVLARMGFDVAVIDKSAHPRFAIGESSTPTTDAYLAKISSEFDIPEILPLATYQSIRKNYPDLTAGKKRGFSFFWHQKGLHFSPGDQHENEMIVAASPNDQLADSNWLRSEIDSRIVSWFFKYDVKLIDSCAIRAIKMSRGRWKFDLSQDNRERELNCEYFLDASGASGVGIRALGGKCTVSELLTNTSATFAHFQDLPRWSERLTPEQQIDHPFVCDEAAVHHLFRSGWLWQLRFFTGLTSCGVVQSNHNRGMRRNPAWDATESYTFFRGVVDRYPSLRHQFAKAVAVTPQGGAYYRHRLQHLFNKVAGTRWSALPNSIGFVDPLFSKGMGHAFSGLYRLARLLKESGGVFNLELDFEIEKLCHTFREEILYLDRFIGSCYLCLDKFEDFQLAALWYFTAATNFEHLLTTTQSFDRPFLFFEDMRFRQALFEFSERCRARRTGDSNSTESLRDFAREQLLPFDRVGLFNPPIPNMLGGTAAPPGTKPL